MNVTFPALLNLADLSLFVLRLVVALVFGSSGWFHLRDPVGRGKGIGLSPTATRGLGAAELLASLGMVTGILVQPAAIGLILLGLGAIQKKVFAWKTGIWGPNGTDGWHYDLTFLAMNLVILCTAGGAWAIRLGGRQ
jgi:putative oxidoreductase